MPEPAKRFIMNVEQRVYVEKSWGHEDWIYTAGTAAKSCT